MPVDAQMRSTTVLREEIFLLSIRLLEKVCEAVVRLTSPAQGLPRNQMLNAFVCERGNATRQPTDKKENHMNELTKGVVSEVPRPSLFSLSDRRGTV